MYITDNLVMHRKYPYIKRITQTAERDAMALL